MHTCDEEDHADSHADDQLHGGVRLDGAEAADEEELAHALGHLPEAVSQAVLVGERQNVRRKAIDAGDVQWARLCTM